MRKIAMPNVRCAKGYKTLISVRVCLKVGEGLVTLISHCAWSTAIVRTCGGGFRADETAISFQAIQHTFAATAAVADRRNLAASVPGCGKKLVTPVWKGI